MAAVIGVAAGILVGLLGYWKAAPLAAWDIAAVAYMASTWRRVLRFTPDLVKRHALRDDPSRWAADLIVLIASVASLTAVALVLSRASADSGPIQLAQVAFGLASVVVSWAIIHTVYAQRYAELYYRGPGAPIDFGDTHTPVYADFAYLAFTMGMTFQVSDTTLKTSQFRRVALVHALLSYLFGTVIIATTISFIAGLIK